MQGINDDQSFEENLNDVSDDKGDPGTISLKGKDTFLNAKNKRRSKKDKVGRNYLCGCGKEYLSYPALYTHIKTKHDGVQPEGTKAHSASTSKRGRPKKIDFKGEDGGKFLQNSDNSNHLPGMGRTHGQSSDIKPILSDLVLPSDLRIVERFGLHGSSNPSDGFPVIKLCNDDKPTFHPFHIIMHKLMSENKLDSSSNCSPDYGMSLFLFGCSKICVTSLYTVLGIFFRNLRECLNDHGYDVLQNYLNEKYGEEAKTIMSSSNKGKIYCVEETMDYLPLIADKFILEYLPKHCPDFDQQLAVDIMYDFCNWLTRRKLTKIKLSFSENQAMVSHSDSVKIEEKKSI